MKVTFKELGFVKSCTVDLNKDLTILCGPNNSGKTYVACAVYGLLKSKHSYTFGSDLSVFDNIFKTGQVQIDVLPLITNSLLDNIANAYYSEIPKVFASDDALFSNTKIEIQLDYQKIEQQWLARRIEGTGWSWGTGNFSFSYKKQCDNTLITFTNTSQDSDMTTEQMKS